LALEFDKEIEFFEDKTQGKKIIVERAPVVTIMGHVDHGKTTLLDAFRHSNRADHEYGAITQSIGAFTFKTDNDHEITFIDTPGHEAFNNLRVRGAKVTDIIILVISAIESVQPQTIEVIEIARSLRIPVIVAMNKIDRPAADVEAVLLDLSSHNLIPEQLGGDVICVPISAKEGTNLDLLEEKIIEVATTKLDLKEDLNTKAQCFVIESNFDDKTTQITATVLVKKGTLRQEDVFVCGTNEGKVRFLINDQGKQIKEVHPGQAVKLGGFKTFPDVGAPLYAVKDHEEAQFIVSTIRNRKERESNMTKVDSSQKAHELKKGVKGLTRIEKGKIYGGDKTIMYEKLGLVEESDLERYRKKLGIRKGVDLASLDLEDVDSILEASQAEGKGTNNVKDPKSNPNKKLSYMQRAKKDFDKEEFKKIISDLQSEKAKMSEMSEQERAKYQEDKLKLKEVFRDEDVRHFPIILKASTAGTLETLMQEVEKVIKGIYRINVIDYSVGPITEGDLSNAASTGGVIFGFDVSCNPIVTKSSEAQGVTVHQHKLIYKFVEDIENYVHDVKKEMQEEQGHAVNIDIMGSASIAQIFKVKDPRSKQVKMIPVAGSRVIQGELERKYKYRVVRGEKVL
jgi:small GTP-binding protein